MEPANLSRSKADHVALAHCVKRNSEIVSLSGNTHQLELDSQKVRHTFSPKALVLSWLIRMNCWKLVQGVLDRLAPCFIVTPCDHLVESFSLLIQYLLDPVYSELPKPLFSSFSAPLLPPGDLSPATTQHEALEYINLIIPYVGPGLGKCPDGYIKVCKVLQHCACLEEGSRVLTECLIPGLSLAPCEVVKCLYKCIQALPHQRRYTLYESWRNYTADGQVLIEQSLTVMS